jgi:hypothetical protein
MTKETNSEAMEKDQAIIELLDWLQQRLGDQFTVTDHWEALLCAIGISASDDPAQLVYIQVMDAIAGRFAVELESEPSPGSDLLYRTIGKFDSVTREDLLGIITKHLGIRSPTTPI